ncbi:MAG: CaiB/BaiF CoA-transferase family protein [Geminicoccaceae bacterium]
MRSSSTSRSGADAVACNLRGDVPAKLGITYAHLAPVNPKIVCAFLSAYGRDGSRAAWPGYDYLIQAEAGYFALNGEPDLAAVALRPLDRRLHGRLRHGAGAGRGRARGTRQRQGRDVDVALYDVGLANLTYLAAWAANAGHAVERAARSAHPSLVPCQLFRTGDGWIYIMANKERFFPELCPCSAAPELALDPRFSGFAERLVHRAELEQRLDAAFMASNTAAWLERLQGRVPAAPIQDMAEALASPFTRERGMLVDVAGEGGAALKLMGSPFRAGEPVAPRAAPRLGQDTGALLAEAGYDAARIADLRRRGIIG